MTPRHRETRPIDQPVRFYKVIALSFLALTLVLLGAIVFLSSKRTTITITTKDTPVDVTVDALAKDVGGTFSTTTVSLSGTFSPEGQNEVPGKAQGTVVLHNETDADQPLVATTRVLSSSGVLFRLDTRVTVPKKGTVSAPVTADKEGKEGEIGPDKFTIPGLTPDKQKVIYATSVAGMTGGVRTTGVLSQKDIDTAVKTLRDRAIEQLKKETSSGNADMGAVVSFVSESHTVVGEIGKETSGFTVNMTATLARVTYNAAQVLDRAKAGLLAKAVDDTETIEPSNDAPQVTAGTVGVDGPHLSLFFAGVSHFNPDSKLIEKAVFFGKTRDEVRRYVLSLNHVYTVEVKMSPPWIQTVPHVADHVTVEVKSVQ